MIDGKLIKSPVRPFLMTFFEVREVWGSWRDVECVILHKSSSVISLPSFHIHVTDSCHGVPCLSTILYNKSSHILLLLLNLEKL